MGSRSIFRMAALMACLSCLLQITVAHSWVEQLTLIAANGTFVGNPGYARGNVLRTSPDFGDPRMTNLIPPNGRPAGSKILPTDKMCKDTQLSQTQTDGSPRLQAPPGAAVALRYQENGHVTLPENQPGKPPNRGNVYVYGTTNPSPDDTLLSIHKVWNENGTGGDGRGMLLSVQNFDDGRCYQVNGNDISKTRQTDFPHTADKLMGADMWCQQDIRLPGNVPQGKPYTLYWVWDWPTAPNADPGLPDGKAEVYTTCMDIDIVAESPMKDLMSGSGYIKEQPLDRAAIPSQMADLEKIPMIPEPASSTTSMSCASSDGAGRCWTRPTGNLPRSPSGFITSTMTSISQSTVVTSPPFANSSNTSPPPAPVTPTPTLSPGVFVPIRSQKVTTITETKSSGGEDGAHVCESTQAAKRHVDEPRNIEAPSHSSPRLPSPKGRVRRSDSSSLRPSSSTSAFSIPTYGTRNTTATIPTTLSTLASRTVGSMATEL